MSEIHQMSLREIQVKIEKEIKSIQYQLKIQDFNSALQFANEIKNKYTSPEEKSVLEKFKFDSMHNKIIAHKLDSEFAIIEEKLIKELKIPKIDKADGYVADMKGLLNKIIANGTNIEKYQKRIDDLKIEINKIAKLNPHLNPVPKAETDVEINQAPAFTDQIQAKQKPKKHPKRNSNNSALTIIDRPSPVETELNQELKNFGDTPPTAPPISVMPTAPPPIKSTPPPAIPPATIPPATIPPPALVTPPAPNPPSPHLAPPNSISPPLAKPQSPPLPTNPAIPQTSPSPFQPLANESNNTELISPTEISSFKQDLESSQDVQTSTPSPPKNMKTHTNQTTKIISAPPPASIPSSISILVENAGYTRLSIKPRTPILEQLFNTFQVYYKCSDSYKASHHHFLFVKYTFNNYSISLTPEYLCSPREEQLPEAEKLQLKETRIQDDLYLPFALIKQFIDDFFKTMTEEGNSNSKIIDGTITAIRELYALIYSSNQLSIQRYPIFLRFAGKPLTINFSTILIFPKSTKFHQKIPGIPSKYGIFYCNEDSLPSCLDYFNSKYGILNGIREEHINKLIIPQADKDFYDGVIKSGILLTVFSIISGVAWLLNWNVVAVIGGILWICVGAHIFIKKRNQFATTYNKNQDNHFFSYLKFTPDQVAATMKHFIVPQHKELFKAEYSFTHTIKVKSPNVPVVKTKPQKPVSINPPTSTIIKSEALFGDLANFFD